MLKFSSLFSFALVAIVSLGSSYAQAKVYTINEEQEARTLISTQDGIKISTTLGTQFVREFAASDLEFSAALTKAKVDLSALEFNEVTSEEITECELEIKRFQMMCSEWIREEGISRQNIVECIARWNQELEMCKIGRQSYEVSLGDYGRIFIMRTHTAKDFKNTKALVQDVLLKMIGSLAIKNESLSSKRAVFSVREQGKFIDLNILDVPANKDIHKRIWVGFDFR